MWIIAPMLAFLVIFFGSAYLIGSAIVWLGKKRKGDRMHRFLSTILECSDVYNLINGKPVLYLRRYFLRHSSDTKGGIYLHHILLSDAERHAHDHPWKYTSIILAGGYSEEAWRSAPGIWPWISSTQWYKVGRVLKRPATWLHRLRLPFGKTCWSLVITGPREREWGFETEEGWVEEKVYKKAQELT